jgi:hypothetical protein
VHSYLEAHGVQAEVIRLDGAVETAIRLGPIALTGHAGASIIHAHTCFNRSR